MAQSSRVYECPALLDISSPVEPDLKRGPKFAVGCFGSGQSKLNKQFTYPQPKTKEADMNKTKKQSPKNSPVKLNEKDLKEVSGGYGNYGTTPTNPGGIALN